MDRWKLELAIVIISFGIFVGYHLWLFVIHDKVHPGRLHSAWAMGRKARAVACMTWASREQDVVTGIQAIRNSLTGITFMSALTGILATLIVPIMLDPVKTDRIKQLAMNDPIMSHATGPPLVPPVAVLACSVGVLWASFCYFAQSMRLYVHLSFLLRAVSSPLNHDRDGRVIFSQMDARRVSVKAGMAFTIGLRLWYLFVPVISWSLGPTSLLISSALVTLLCWRFDQFDVRGPPEEELDDDECAHGMLLAPVPEGQGEDEEGGSSGGRAASLAGGVAGGARRGGAAVNGDVEAGTRDKSEEEQGVAIAAAAAAAATAGVPMTALRPAARVAPPLPPPPPPAASRAASGASVLAPPERAASGGVQLSDLSRLSAEQIRALSWHRCPHHQASGGGGSSSPSPWRHAHQDG